MMAKRSFSIGMVDKGLRRRAGHALGHRDAPYLVRLRSEQLD
jgi:hypothetical protein